MTGVKIHNNEEYENTLVGLMLFVTTANYSLINNGLQATRGGSFKDCFLEATGIAAGSAVVAGLAEKTVSKAVVKATLKMVSKIGTRTLSGVGLALIAAEITWCYVVNMTSNIYLNIRHIFQHILSMCSNH